MNKELLLETVKFPLKWDTKSYKLFIFDADMNMIAMVDRDIDATQVKHPFEKLIGDYKEPEINYVQFRLDKGDFYDVFNPDTPIGCVRGWGRIQYLDRAEEIQDNIAEYILGIINT